jgi:hypothetical protein
MSAKRCSKHRVWRESKCLSGKAAKDRTAGACLDLRSTATVDTQTSGNIDSVEAIKQFMRGQNQQLPGQFGGLFHNLFSLPQQALPITPAQGPTAVTDVAQRSMPPGAAPSLWSWNWLLHLSVDINSSF